MSNENANGCNETKLYDSSMSIYKVPNDWHEKRCYYVLPHYHHAGILNGIAKSFFKIFASNGYCRCLVWVAHDGVEYYNKESFF